MLGARGQSPHEPDRHDAANKPSSRQRNSNANHRKCGADPRQKTRAIQSILRSRFGIDRVERGSEVRASHDIATGALQRMTKTVTSALQHTDALIDLDQLRPRSPLLALSIARVRQFSMCTLFAAERTRRRAATSASDDSSSARTKLPNARPEAPTNVCSTFGTEVRQA